ncbi:MAG: voltage-gated chloride channel, partial [Chlorobi bacterium]|nr:voltage-gated chloride channel [Chlorobiota bacterium]
GFEQIKTILVLGGAPLLAFYFKTLAMAITVHGGGSGGLVTPLFFIGAAAGSAFAQLLGLDQATFAAIGMISVLAGATNTPIASSVLGVELFGMELGTYATVSALIAFLLTGHRSLFPSQKMMIIKAKGIKIQRGETIGKTYVKGTVLHREELLISRLYRQVKKLYLSKVKKRS